MITFLITVGGMFIGWLVARWLAGRTKIWTSITGMAAGAVWGVARLVELNHVLATIFGVVLAVALVLRGISVRKTS